MHVCRQVVMVPLEVTHTALVTDAVLASIRTRLNDSNFSKLVIELLTFFKETCHAVFGSSFLTSDRQIRNPKPETRNPEPRIRNPESEIRNPKPETQSPKPEIRDPKPETRISEPGTRNPKPET